MRARLLGFCAAVFIFAALASFVVTVHHYDVTTPRTACLCDECWQQLSRAEDHIARETLRAIPIDLDPCEPIADSSPGKGWACTKFAPGGLCCRWEQGRCADLHSPNCAD